MKNTRLLKSMLLFAFLSISLFAYSQSALGPAQVSNQTTNPSNSFECDTDVAMNSSNKYAISWSRKTGGSLNGESVFARIFNSNGSAVTNDITVDGTNKTINNPQIGMDDSDNIYVIYDISATGVTRYLRVKKFNSSGNQVGNTLTLGQIDQSCYYDIDVKGDGRFVVFYTTTSNTTRLRLFSSSLSHIKSTNVSTGIKHYKHQVDVRGSTIALGYTSANETKFKKYSISGTNLIAAISTQTLPGDFCRDPIALRPNGEVAFLLRDNSIFTKLHIRNSNGSFKTSHTIYESQSSDAGVDADVNNKLYLACANPTSSTNGRVYSSSDNLIGTFNHQIPSFWEPAIAVYDCKFVVVGREQSGSTLKIWNRRFSCEDCSFDTNFTYSFTCLGSTVEITATANTNYPSSVFNLYQPPSPSTSGPQGPVLSSQSGNSVTFTVPNEPGAYYVIKHGNWSANCPWSETRKLLYIPTFNDNINTCFNYNISGGSNNSVTNIGLSPCWNDVTTSHWWFLYRGNSSNGPWTSTAIQSSTGNGSVAFNNQTKGYYYRVLHYAKNPCTTTWAWTVQVFYVSSLVDDPIGVLVQSETGYGKDLPEFIDQELLVEEDQIIFDQSGELKFDFNEEGLPTDKASAEDVVLYPTPSYDFVNLKFKKDIVVENIQVYNTNGQLVKTIIADQNRIMTIDVSDLVVGSYYIKLQTTDQIIVKQFVKI